MPPKGKKKKGPLLIDGIDTSAMTREQLEGFAQKLKNELDREREERNFFQLERDKLRTFWEITREKLEQAQNEVSNKDHDIEVTQETTDIEIKHVMQQMKHLQYENQTKIGEIRAEAMSQLKIAQEENEAQQQELLKDKRELRSMLREANETTELQIQQLKMEHSEELRGSFERFEQEAQEMISLHEQKLNLQNEKTEIINQMEMFEVEERKCTQISNLIKQHDFAFSEMKNYYNDITLNNLALISSLKEQMEELRKQSERQERIANETMAENKRLVEPLSVAQNELVDLRRKVEHYDRDRIQLEKLKKKFIQTEKDFNALKWESEALIMRNETIVNEREELKDKFEESIMELQQKTGLKNVLLERRVKILEEDAETREALLNEAVIASGLEPDKVGMKIENLLHSKNELIQDLKYELARVCKAHDDLLSTYEAKLMKFGIPKEELGFEPLRTLLNVKFGAGPAGLVTKNR